MTAEPEASIAQNPWPRRLAVLTAGATCVLILVGGLVTHTGSGLAVPDWPTTFGENMFLYPLSQMRGGVLYEHSHRLLGSLVGLLTVALAAAIFVTERRPWLRGLGVLVVIAVIVQGILGGLRVVLLAHVLAMIHGAIAPAFLALVGAIAVFCSAAWLAPAPSRGEALRPLRWYAAVMTAVVYLQIVFGVILTHTGRRLDAHLLLAAVVSLLVPLLTRRVLAVDVQATRRPARLLQALWLVQLLLGLAAYAVRFHGLGADTAVLALGLPLAHRLAGALLLVAAVVLTLHVFRLAVAGRNRAPVPAGSRVPA
jgi:cytochrome c oxidase assembly protein subunit 15